MKTIELKTNIMCASCVAKVTPVLNRAVGEGTWKVDTQHPKKVLTVTTEELHESDIIKAVQKAGFKAEEVN